MRPCSTADLSWFFGTGASTWAGDAGLRSSMGSQVAVLEMGGHAGMVDASASEDMLISRLGSAHAARRIEARLRSLPADTVQVLRIHFSLTATPCGVETCAIVLPSARRLVVGHLLGLIRAERAAARKAGRELDPAVRHRYLYEALHWRRESVMPPEVLRRALMEASRTRRERLDAEATQLLRDAIEAYETTVLPAELEHAKPPQIGDPRRSRSL